MDSTDDTTPEAIELVADVLRVELLVDLDGMPVISVGDQPRWGVFVRVVSAAPDNPPFRPGAQAILAIESPAQTFRVGDPSGETYRLWLAGDANGWRTLRAEPAGE